MKLLWIDIKYLQRHLVCQQSVIWNTKLNLDVESSYTNDSNSSEYESGQEHKARSQECNKVVKIETGYEAIVE